VTRYATLTQNCTKNYTDPTGCLQLSQDPFSIYRAELLGTKGTAKASGAIGVGRKELREEEQKEGKEEDRKGKLRVHSTVLFKSWHLR